MLLRLRRAWPDRRTRRWLAPLMGIALLACGLVGGPVAVLAGMACVAGTFVLAAAMIPHADRHWALDWVMGAVAIRVGVAAVVHAILLVRGPYGALFLDDAGYAQIALALADHWHGRGLPPFIDPSFDHNYVKLAAVVFYLVGPNVLALKLVNTFFGLASALVLHRIAVAADVPGRRWALVLMLVFPSLVAWSALALKDAYSLFFSLLAVWGVTEFIRTRRYRIWFPVTIAALLALENVRAFLFVILAVAWPLALLLGLRARRVVPAAAAALVVAALLVTTSALNYLDPNIITASVYVRQAMARGASSRFVAPLPIIRAAPCTLFVVSVPGRTPAPDGPRQIDVPVGTELVIESPGASPGPGRLLVRPGDIVAVAGSTPCPVALVETPAPATRTPAIPTPTGPAIPASPTPRPARTPITELPAVVLVPEARNVVSTPAPSTGDALAFSRDLVETVAHLPIGALALLAAPFPLLARSLGELATAPEMLAWYAIIGLAAIGLRQLSGLTLARLAYALTVLVLVAIVLSLYEGNLGTLVRHRAMIIPFVILLAAAGATSRWPRAFAR